MSKEFLGYGTKFEVREMDSDGQRKPTIEGYASVYDEWYDLGLFKERIQKGAFNGAIANSDIRALINHDANRVLGRKKANTLIVTDDDNGLRYVIIPPETQYANDLIVSMKRGDIDQSSFAFTVEDDEWDIDENGGYRRTITKIRELFDVSPVTYPASPNTDSFVRSANEQLLNEGKMALEKKSSEIKDVEKYLDELELIDMKNK